MAKSDQLQSFFRFIENSPTAYHGVQQGASMLTQSGFQRLTESQNWNNLKPGSYFVTRNMSSLIAFHLTEAPHGGQRLRMAGAHTDSPGLKVKPSPIIQKNGCLQIGVEVYGGALLNPWFDRDLSLAGSVSWHQDDAPIHIDLINFKRPIATIPSLAIHLDREANSKRVINKQTDITPLAMLIQNDQQYDFKGIIAEQLQQEHPTIKDPAILDFDLFFYDIQPPCNLGLENDFLTGARFDNLLSCYALLEAMTTSSSLENSLIILNDHEEVGSVSTTGAQGSFLQSVLHRLYPEPAHFVQVLGSSFFISVDNAHAVHPNFPQKYDDQHLPELNKGVVLKKNANQRYATNSFTGGFFKYLCKKADTPYQEFVMRNDMACGSTIGPMTSAALGVPTVDVGIPQLGMHSIRETVGRDDFFFLLKTLQTFFQESSENMTAKEPE